jgi:hypothetical protein
LGCVLAFQANSGKKYKGDWKIFNPLISLPVNIFDPINSFIVIDFSYVFCVVAKFECRRIIFETISSTTSLSRIVHGWFFVALNVLFNKGELQGFFRF